MTKARTNSGVWRAVLVLGGLLATLAWIKLATTLGFGFATTTAWNLKDFQSSQQLSQLQLVENSIEPHKAHFNLGTSLAARGELVEAGASLEEALALAPPADDCAVRLNLALVLEALGQEQAEPAATQSLERSRSVIDGAQSACRAGTLATIDGRLQSGDQPAEPQDVEGEGENGDEPGAPQSVPDDSDAALDEIRDRMTSGSGRQHEEQESRSSQPDGEAVDQPW